MENVNSDNLEIPVESPSNLQKKRGRPKGDTKPYICPKCGYQTQLMFRMTKHLSRGGRPCDPTPEVQEQYILGRSKERLTLLIQEWDGLPKMKKNKKRLSSIVKEINKLVLAICRLEKLDPEGSQMKEYQTAVDDMRKILDGIK